jgi:hypothetical protein
LEYFGSSPDPTSSRRTSLAWDEGNLIQLLKLREADVDGLSSWIQNGNYLSHDIINEICQIISLSITRDLVKEVKNILLRIITFYTLFYFEFFIH